VRILDDLRDVQRNHIVSYIHYSTFG
jgi:hypothetical protein